VASAAVTKEGRLLVLLLRILVPLSRRFVSRAAFACLASGVVTSGLLAIALLTLGGSDARAQGKLDGRYVATLAGVTIGKGAWVVDITDDQYTAAASGMTTGLLRVFASGEGTGAARGYVSNGNLIPSSYAASLTADKKTEELRIVISGGTVRDYSVEPPTPPHPDRIPIADAHRHGVTDPMTGTLMRVAGNGDVVSPEACARTIAIFDGRMRYDLKLAFKRMETVKAEKGYEGQVVVCAVYFTPLAGYIPDRPAIKYLIAQRDMEIWLAPIAGTRVMVPFRTVIPTPLGTGVLEATQFITQPQPPRATPTSANLQ
jgi:Protein of unknown function (DUF3108)